MKKMTALLLGVILIFTGCSDNNSGADKKDPLTNFDWKTTKQIPINIQSDNEISTPIFIYNGETLVAAGYTPFNETIVVPVSVSSLSVTTFPKNPEKTKAYVGDWIWPLGKVVEVPLANGSSVVVSGLIDLHADIFSRWNGWRLSGFDWSSFVDNWNAGATQNSSIILYKDKMPFIATDNSNDVEHACLWPDCHHGKEISGTSTVSGTYLFEDLFPSMGDYDMNDMVVEEYITTTVGGKNMLKSAELLYHVNAAGSGVAVAMAVAMPNVKPSDIEKVEMFQINASGEESAYVCNNASGLFGLNNGIEVSNANETVIPLFDNVKLLMKLTTAGKFFNTSLINGGKGEPIRIKVKVLFKSSSAVSATSLTDLFIMPKAGAVGDDLGKWRGREIHLADSKPTSKMDSSLFGQSDTAPAGKAAYQTFRSKNGYVWAIYLPVVGFKHPVESEQGLSNKIYDSYLGFKNWVETNGAQNSNWYLFPVNSRVWNW